MPERADRPLAGAGAGAAAESSGLAVTARRYADHGWGSRRRGALAPIRALCCNGERGDQPVPLILRRGMSRTLKSLVAILSLAVALAAGPARAQPAHPTARKPGPPPQTADQVLAAAVLAELNAARAHPADYADALRRYRSYYQDNLVKLPGDPIGVRTFEGVAAVDEAIAYVAARPPMPPLKPNADLARAAARFAAESGSAGLTGHVNGSGEGLGQRLRAAGVWAGAEAEDIALGMDTAEAVARQLIIDDGVPGRGHRTAIFDPGLEYAGVACAPHRLYRRLCVIDFAGELVAR